MDIKDYRITSLDFRRIASNMLMSNADNATVQLIRFKQYIDSSPIISVIIKDKISGIEYNFKDCFFIDNTGWNEINPPIDEVSHLKAQYDYISYICSNKIDVKNIAHGFHHSSSSWNDIVREFLDSAFKALVDFITDSLSKEIMLLEEDRPMGNIMQNIDKNYGTINASGKIINSSNITNVKDIGEISELIEKLLPTVSSSGLTAEGKDDLVDDLDTISEQIKSNDPKISRIRKAYENIKGFVVKVSNGAATTALLLTDWQKLVEKLGELIENF